MGQTPTMLAKQIETEMHQPRSPSSLGHSDPSPNSAGSSSGEAAFEAVLSVPKKRLTKSEMSCGRREMGMCSVLWASIQLEVIRPSLWLAPS